MRDINLNENATVTVALSIHKQQQAYDRSVMADDCGLLAHGQTRQHISTSFLLRLHDTIRSYAPAKLKV